MKKVVSHVWIWLVLAFLYLPIIILSVYSFTDARLIGESADFSVRNYVTLFTVDELISMMVGTVVLALVVATLSTILGTAGAIGAFYSKRRTNSLIGLFNEVPVANAEVVTGFSICILFVAIFHVDKNSYVPLIIGQMVLCTPFVFLSVLPRLKQMDTNLYSAALDLGCRPMKAIFKITLPQIFPGIISGFMLAITLSLDDYFIATYTKPATFDTISTYVVNATRGAQTSIKTALWALSALIFVIVILITVFANRRRKEEKNEA